MSDWGAFPLADQSAEPPTPWDAFPKVTAGGMAKAFGTGLAKGGIALAGLAGDIPELGAQGIHKATQAVGGLLGVDVPERAPQPSAIGSDAIQRQVEKATGEFRKPQNTAEEYAQTVGEFAPGMVGGSLGAIARNAVKYVAIP